MLEQKQGHFWYLHVILNKALKRDFQFSSYFSDDGGFSNGTSIISKILIFCTFDLQ